MHHDVAPVEYRAGKIGNDAAIVDAEPGPVVVERASHHGADPVLPGEHDAQRFAVALRFVVAGARTGAGDVAPVVFGRRNGIRERIAVDLAAAVEEKSLERPAPVGLGARHVQQPAQAVDVGVHRFQRQAAIDHR